MSADDVPQKNLLGLPLETCSNEPLTGYFRTGCCETDDTDLGSHTVCTQVTEEFLEFSKRRGNDLSTPRPGFAGLRPGDRWCVCAPRYKEALDAGVTAPVVLAATHEEAALIIPRETLLAHGIDVESLN
jgi:uncharacterized protein (DUF2237 family)